MSPARSGPARPAGGRRATRPAGWKWLLVAPTVMGLGVALALLLAWHLDVNSPTPGEQSASLAEGGLTSTTTAAFDRLTPSNPSAYRIVYRVTEPGSPTTLDVRDISRPFEGRELTTSLKGAIQTGVVSNDSAAYLFVSSPKPHWAELQGGTNRATGDQFPVPALQEATRHGLARVLGAGRVLGRRCTEVRTGAPIGSAMTAPSKSEYTDMCIDNSTGLILQEIWVLDSKFVRERQAVQLDLSPHFSPSTFSVDSTGPAVPAGQDGSTMASPLDASGIAQLPAWVATPAGFHLDGVLAQTEYEDPGDTGTTTPVTQVVAHFVDGPDLIDLLQGNIAPAPSGGIPVTLAHGRKGVLTLDMSSSYVDVHVGTDAVDVRVEGPDIAQLLQVAGTIQVRPSASAS